MKRVLVLLALSACTAPPLPPRCVSSAPSGPSRPVSHVTENVVLVALDGVRWQEVFDGVDHALAAEAGVPVVGAEALMPNLHALAAGGVVIGAPGHGVPMFASGPAFLSLPSYQELLGGRPAPDCDSNHCRAVTQPTLLDVMSARAPGRVAAIASWERLERATSVDNRNIVLSAGRHHGATREALRVDACASALLDAAAAAGPGPGHADYRPDRWTAPLALAYLRARQPRLLFVGLGDPDEHGHHHDYASYLDALGAIDGFLGELRRTLDAMGDYGAATSIVVTTDHGWQGGLRAHGAGDSGRVWLVAAGGSVPARGAVAAAPYYLADVAPTILALLAPQAPPAPRAIAEVLPPPTALARVP